MTAPGEPPAKGWFEEYKCGCFSKTDRKRDLLGYCAKHGEGRRNVYSDTTIPKRALIALAHHIRKNAGLE